MTLRDPQPAQSPVGPGAAWTDKIIMRNIVFFGASLLLMSTAHGANEVSEPAHCATANKRFEIASENLRFKSFSLLQGKKVLLESREPGENLEIDCSKRPSEKDVNAKWSVQQQIKKSGTNVVVPALGPLSLFQNPDLEIVNKSEFPVRTTVRMTGSRPSITVTDSESGESLEIVCLNPGFGVYARGGGKSRYVFSKDPPPLSATASPPACGDSAYRIQMRDLTIEKSHGSGASVEEAAVHEGKK